MTPNKPHIIGLTGGIASGKSNLSRALREAGAIVIDADQISRDLTAPGGPALAPLRQAFGDGVFEGEALNRQALAALVFADSQALSRLNALMHPMVLDEIRRQIAQHQDELALVIDVPLLYEVGWDKHCDEVWCAWAPILTRMRRLMRRDGLSLKQARAREKSQMPSAQKARRADHVIKTTGTREHSAQQALALWRDALRRAIGDRQATV